MRFLRSETTPVPRRRRIARDITGIVLLVLLVGVVAAKYTTTTAVVISGSMEPTIWAQDYAVFSSVPYWFRSPRPGDIILLRPPAVVGDGSQDPLVKRIVGVPGDTLKVGGGRLLRNSHPIVEPYVVEPMNYSWGPVTVPEDSYVVLGDNRNVADDSHLWVRRNGAGLYEPAPFIPRRAIIGKLIFLRGHSS